MYHVYSLLFDDFETLDLCGPVEMLGQLKDEIALHYISLNGGPVTSSHGGIFMTDPPPETPAEKSILLIPGGFGTRKEIRNREILDLLIRLDTASEYVLTICTGSALLAGTGLLKGKKATSNKKSFSWVMEQGTDIQWVKKARWVQDGKYYTASGVSAGMDMALGFIQDKFGKETAERIALFTEYIWNRDSGSDPFAI